MLNNINMEFLQAFNLLYAAPIVAVILCAFIVYAFGFKSPVPPPSFQGIEEEKKITKKRKTKDTQKANKVLQNGKVNGNPASKSVVVSSKKKESIEKAASTEKSTIEKASVEKKTSKKERAHNEKKLSQEKKKESSIHDDANDGDWVQLISKKGRKNKKKDEIVDVNAQSSNKASPKGKESTKADVSQLEVQVIKDIAADSEASAASKEVVTTSVEKSGKEKISKQVNQVATTVTEKPVKEKIAKDVSQVVNEKPVKEKISKEVSQAAATPAEKHTKEKTSKDVSQIAATPSEKPIKEKILKEIAQITPTEKSKMPITTDIAKPDKNNIEKQPSKEPATKGAKVTEESGKSKKKKKKGAESAKAVEPAGFVSTKTSETPAVQVTSQASTPSEPPAPINHHVDAAKNASSVAVDLPQENSKKNEESAAPEVKTSNVAFDELAGLYPEAKEQRKKKKVRRDH